jgi:hypothetical protein
MEKVSDLCGLVFIWNKSRELSFSYGNLLITVKLQGFR